MGKNNVYGRSVGRVKKVRDPHPIWRALGCLTGALILIISSALAIATVNYVTSARWLLPAGLFGTPRFPDFVWKVAVLTSIARPLTEVANLYAIIALTALYMLILAGISSLAYAIAYRYMGPPTYGPMDVPPLKGVKPKPFKR